MAARRCSNCNFNYDLATMICPRCGGTLWYSQAEEPDRHAAATVDDDEPAYAREIRERKERDRVLWRLGRMVEAFASSQRVLEVEELPLLEQLAAGYENLWDICKVLANPN